MTGLHVFFIIVFTAGLMVYIKKCRINETWKNIFIFCIGAVVAIWMGIKYGT